MNCKLVSYRNKIQSLRLNYSFLLTDNVYPLYSDQHLKEFVFLDRKISSVMNSMRRYLKGQELPYDLKNFIHDKILGGLVGTLLWIKFLKKSSDPSVKNPPSLSKIFDHLNRSFEVLTNYSQEMLQISETFDEVSSGPQHSLNEILEQELITPYQSLFEKQKLNFVVQHINHRRAPSFNHSGLSKIFHNLTLNALDSLVAKRENDRYVKHFPELRYQVQIINRPKETMLYFTDTGIGITRKALPQIFADGFSTKGKNGNGIGLSSVKNVVQKLNGYIGVHSIAIEESLKKDILHGQRTPTTTFHIALPV